VSGLVVASMHEDRPITDAELLSLLTQLLVGGNETTTSLVTNLVWRLLERPERWQAVVDDPTLVEVAVEESLRHDPPVLGLFRATTCPVDIGAGTEAGRLDAGRLDADQKVMLLWASANRDPEVFERPDEVILDRQHNRHLAFGAGIHRCAGSNLARMEQMSINWVELIYPFQRILLVLGHASALILLAKSGAAQGLCRRLAAVGRMALSNYISHSIICTLFFFGYGLNYYAELEFYQIYFVVLVIWAIQLIVSPIWLKYFLFGPLEWLWRSLTYWKLQPMKR
jgi:hypothetical protein